MIEFIFDSEEPGAKSTPKGCPVVLQFSSCLSFVLAFVLIASSGVVPHVMALEVRHPLIFACTVWTLILIEPVTRLIKMANEVFAVLEDTGAPWTSVGDRSTSGGILGVLGVINFRFSRPFCDTGFINLD